MEMKASVSHVKELLERQGYSVNATKEILELFDPPPKPTKGSR
jgi:hypothetical protein